MAHDINGPLLRAMVGALVASVSDPSRLTRGRTYAKHGAVNELEALPGIVTGEVQGSDPTPYSVKIRVDPAERFDLPTALVPSRREVRFSCTCPDSYDPCKHSVAVMLTFAEALVDEPELLGVVRGVPPRGSGPRAVVGSRTAGGPLPPAPEPRLDESAIAALREFLGTPQSLPAADVSAIALPTAPWGELWAEMLADALLVLTEELTLLGEP